MTAGWVRGGDVGLDVVHRFPNGVVPRDGHLRWDIERIFAEVDAGLALVPDAESIGVSTWGVDYGLLDGDDRLLADPVAYRDDRTATVIDAVHAAISPAELYGITGLQHLPFNTIYQLAVERSGPLWDRTARVALIPDLIAHHLTGRLATEVTNASTTGLLDARSHEWSASVLERVGIPAEVLPALDGPGQRRGRTPAGVPVVNVGSHDTASAVVGVPAATERFAFVVSGTWSLVGVELPAPVLTAEAREANFTNELGVDGRTRFLRNVGGLWLLQECLRTWRRDDLSHLCAEAAALPAGGPLIDVDDRRFIGPDDMPARIAAAAGRPHLDVAETVRCIFDSLAAAYARTVNQASALSGRDVEVIHVVGGGSQNDLLGQLTADACGRPVLAGPVEATAHGNVIVQARAAGALPASLDEIRHRLAGSLALRRFDPR